MVIACGREADRADSSGSQSPSTAVATARADSAAAPPAPTTPAAASTATCLSEGQWQSCSVEKRLTDAGFVPIKKGPSPTVVFTVPGTSYALGPAELHIYLFPSAKDREQAVAAIDTVAVARRGSTAAWTIPPTFITSNNLAAILLSDNGRLIERVQNAITAGLPAASR